MDFKDLANNIISLVLAYAKAHPVAAGIALVAALVFSYRRPMAVLAILVLGLVLAGLFYAIMEMGGSGVSRKEKMIRKENVPDEIFRATPIKLEQDFVPPRRRAE